MRDRKSDQHRKVSHAQPGEDVHHKDGNKENNDPMNLEKMSHRSHSRTTAREGKHVRALKRSLTMIARKEKLY
jgi:hypothetical protein